MKARIAVLIPCYNERKTVGKVVKDFARELPDSKVYVFDNNSSDDSAKIASSAGAIVERVTLQGKGNVIREMFRRIDADIYVMVDADDTYDAKDAHKMIKEVQNGADMVIGDRLNSTYFQENKRFGHNFGNVLVRKLINFFFKSNIQDVMTGYRAFSKAFVKTCPILSDGFQVETEMTAHALDKKMNIMTVAVGYKDRSADNPSKLNTYSDGAKVLILIFNLIREYRPLLFFTSLSVIVFAIALILGIPVFIDFLKTGLVDRFPTLIVSGMMIVLSFLSFTTGIILDIIIRKSKQQFQIEYNLVKMQCKR